MMVPYRPMSFAVRGTPMTPACVSATLMSPEQSMPRREFPPVTWGVPRKDWAWAMACSIWSVVTSRVRSTPPRMKALAPDRPALRSASSWLVAAVVASAGRGCASASCRSRLRTSSRSSLLASLSSAMVPFCLLISLIWLEIRAFFELEHDESTAVAMSKRGTNELVERRMGLKIGNRIPGCSFVCYSLVEKTFRGMICGIERNLNYIGVHNTPIH